MDSFGDQEPTRHIVRTIKPPDHIIKGISKQLHWPDVYKFIVSTTKHEGVKVISADEIS